jgi:hypothetical protein
VVVEVVHLMEINLVFLEDLVVEVDLMDQQMVVEVQEIVLLFLPLKEILQVQVEEEMHHTPLEVVEVELEVLVLVHQVVVVQRKQVMVVMDQQIQ